MLSSYSIASGKSRKDAIIKIRAKPIVLTDKQLEEKIKSGAATLKQRNLLLFRKQRDLKQKLEKDSYDHMRKRLKENKSQRKIFKIVSK